MTCGRIFLVFPEVWKSWRFESLVYLLSLKRCMVVLYVIADILLSNISLLDSHEAGIRVWVWFDFYLPSSPPQGPCLDFISSCCFNGSLSWDEPVRKEKEVKKYCYFLTWKFVLNVHFIEGLIQNVKKLLSSIW